MKIQKLIDIRLVLQKDILANNADIRGTTLYLDGNIGWLYPKVTDSDFRIFEDQFPVCLLNGRAGEASAFQHTVGLVT